MQLSCTARMCDVDTGKCNDGTWDITKMGKQTLHFIMFCMKFIKHAISVYKRIHAGETRPFIEILACSPLCGYTCERKNVVEREVSFWIVVGTLWVEVCVVICSGTLSLCLTGLVLPGWSLPAWWLGMFASHTCVFVYVTHLGGETVDSKHWSVLNILFSIHLFWGKGLEGY